MIIELSSLHAYLEIRETTRIEFCFVDTGWTQCITLSFLRGGFAIALEGILADLFFIDYSLFMSLASFFACRTQQQKSFLHSEKKRKILISGRPGEESIQCWWVSFRRIWAPTTQCSGTWLNARRFWVMQKAFISLMSNHKFLQCAHWFDGTFHLVLHVPSKSFVAEWRIFPRNFHFTKSSFCVSMA